MKTFLTTIIAFLLFTINCKAQWTTSGTNIYNSNTGYVGIGTTAPVAKLTIGNASATGYDQLVILSTLGAGAQSGIVFRTPYLGTTYDGSITSSFYNGTGGMIFTAPRDYTGDYGFQFNSNSGTPRMFINTLSGNVGIGTTSPTSALQIGNFANGAPSNQIIIPGSYNFEQIRFGQIGNGNSQLEFVNHTSVSNSYGIKMLVDVDHGASGLQIQYAPTNTGYASLSYTTGLYLNLSGNVGIGTTTPDQKLTVNGTVHSKAVVVDNSIFPDYVFSNTYALRPLSAVKTYIDINHHLPEMPSAAEVTKNGQNLGEMNTLLLKKVEELTLYMIEKDKQQLQQQAQINQLKKQVGELLKAKK